MPAACSRPARRPARAPRPPRSPPCRRPSPAVDADPTTRSGAPPAAHRPRSRSAPASRTPEPRRLAAEPALASTGPSVVRRLPARRCRRGSRASRPPARRRRPTATGPSPPARGDDRRSLASTRRRLRLRPSRAARARPRARRLIPERRTVGSPARAGRAGRLADRVDADRLRASTQASRPPPTTTAPRRRSAVRPRGPVVGGRAAKRAERQAAEHGPPQGARSARAPAVAVLDELEADGAGRKPRRVVKGLLAMTVVALGVLGVYSFVSPRDQGGRGATSPATQRSAPALAPGRDRAAARAAEHAGRRRRPRPRRPVRAPITVLNATTINGLAAKAADGVRGGGLGDPRRRRLQRQRRRRQHGLLHRRATRRSGRRRVQLVDAFPQLQGPAPRFFELPADVPAPGLVVVLAGDWSSPDPVGSTGGGTSPPLVRWPQRALPPRARAFPPALRRPRDARRPARRPAARRLVVLAPRRAAADDVRTEDARVPVRLGGRRRRAGHHDLPAARRRPLHPRRRPRARFRRQQGLGGRRRPRPRRARLRRPHLLGPRLRPQHRPDRAGRPAVRGRRPVAR